MNIYCRFISMLGAEFIKSGCSVFHADGDADFLIVQKALESAETNHTVVVGDDTDLLVLLIYHTKVESKDLYLMPEPKKNAKQSKIWDIKDLKVQLHPAVCQHILFIHCFLGCDTTSRLHGIGKGAALKKIQTNAKFKAAAEKFDENDASSAEIATAGEQAFLIIYNAKASDTLNSLRYKKFVEKVSCSSSHVAPQQLPPTSAAAKFHSFRVYLQICSWKNQINSLTPENWGWKKEDDEFFPIPTDIPPAPEDLLKIIRCNCQLDCSSRSCTCRKHEMKCSLACGHCKG